MGTLGSILGASLIIAIALLVLGGGLVFLMDNEAYKNFIKKITH